MAKAGGFLLIAIGLGAAAYIAAPRGDSSVPELPQQIGLVNTAPVPAPKPAAPVPVPQPAFRPVQLTPAPAAAEPVIPPFSAPVVVNLAQRRGGEPGSAPRAQPVPRDRDSLARELQKELKRVGCYEGELTGAWTPATRAAMKAFTDRINATLPVDEPDPILFALVQGQQDKVCGKPCPVGQGLAQDGRCLPNAILAQGAKKAPVASAAPATPSERPAVAITGWSTTTTASAPVLAPVGPLPEGRMALAGPANPNPSGEALPPAEANPPVAAPAPVAPAVAPRSVNRPPRASSQGGGWASSVLRNGTSPN
jgi:hypothetical protein